MHLSPIVAGLWRSRQWGLAAPALAAWVEQALDLGISTFDHADIYGDHQGQALFGEALASTPGLRNRLQIVTKCGIKLVSPQRPQHRVKHYDSSAAQVRLSVEASLRDLRTDRIDLLLLHRPDWLMDPDELAATLQDLRNAGQVLAFGVSNHAPDQLAMLHRRVPLLTHQFEFSPLQMRALADGTLTQCLDLGLQPMIWSPLAGGRLFGGGDGQVLRVQAELSALAADHGVSMATLAHAWILRHPSRPIPITGSGRIEALREAVSARSLRLSAEDWYRVWQASMGQEVA